MNKTSKGLAVVGLILWSIGAQAANYLWDGGGDGVNWSSGDNWDPNVAGGPSTNDFITVGPFAVNTETTLDYPLNFHTGRLTLRQNVVGVTNTLHVRNSMAQGTTSAAQPTFGVTNGAVVLDLYTNTYSWRNGATVMTNGVTVRMEGGAFAGTSGGVNDFTMRSGSRIEGFGSVGGPVRIFRFDEGATIDITNSSMLVGLLGTSIKFYWDGLIVGRSPNATLRWGSTGPGTGGMLLSNYVIGATAEFRGVATNWFNMTGAFTNQLYGRFNPDRMDFNPTTIHIYQHWRPIGRQG